MPQFKDFYDMVDGLKFPGSNGLERNPTILEVKKYTERVQNKKDKYSARRFGSTNFYLTCEFGPGHVYGGSDMFETRAYKFKGSSRAIQRKFNFEPMASTSNLHVLTYVVGH